MAGRAHLALPLGFSFHFGSLLWLRASGIPAQCPHPQTMDHLVPCHAIYEDARQKGDRNMNYDCSINIKAYMRVESLSADSILKMATFCCQRKQLLFQIEFSCTTKCNRNGCVLVVCVWAPSSRISHFPFSIFRLCGLLFVWHFVWQCVQFEWTTSLTMMIATVKRRDVSADRQAVRDWQYWTENDVKRNRQTPRRAAPRQVGIFICDCGALLKPRWNN